MTVSFFERPTSGALSREKCQKIYGVTGTANESQVVLTALASTPVAIWTAYGIMWRQAPTCSVSAGATNWTVDVPYTIVQDSDGSGGGGSWSWRFSTTGGTVHIKAAKSTVSSYPGGAADEHDLIGHHGDDVEGTDIVIPSSKITVSYKAPAGLVNLAWCWAMDDLTGTVNSDTFLGRPAGEILFTGIEQSATLPSSGSSGETSVDFTFLRSKNLTGQVVDAITGIDKQGWDVAWIAWKDDVDAGQAVKVAKAVYVNRVYDRVAFKSVFGFG